MTRSDLTPEDMFEKAREVFSEPKQPSKKPNDCLTDFFKPRNDLSCGQLTILRTKPSRHTRF